MADFVQIMMDWGRMCKDRNCGACNLAGICNTDPESRTYKEIVKIENVVTEWVAEHPEPVYPTWREWLIEQGVIQMVESVGHDDLIPSMMLSVDEPIPADIAEKLGLQPK